MWIQNTSGILQCCPMMWFLSLLCSVILSWCLLRLLRCGFPVLPFYVICIYSVNRDTYAFQPPPASVSCRFCLEASWWCSCHRILLFGYGRRVFLLCGRPFFSICVVSCLVWCSEFQLQSICFLILTARLVGDVWWNVGIRMLLVRIWIFL